MIAVDECSCGVAIVHDAKEEQDKDDPATF